MAERPGAPLMHPALSNPFEFRCDLLAAPDTAGAELLPQARAPAGHIAESSSITGGSQESPAASQPEPCNAAGLLDGIDHIHEIFVGARRLGREPFLWRHEPFAALDEQAFMDAIEPPPLFLQRGYRFARLG